MTSSAEGDDSVSASYAGFASDDETYLVEVVRCEPSKVDAFARDFEAALAERAARSKHLVPVAAWRTVVGPSDEITHIYAFPNLADMEDGSGGLLLEAPMPEATAPWQRSRSVRLAKKLPYGLPLAGREGGGDPPASRIYHVMSVAGTRSGVGDFITHFGSGIPYRQELGAGLVPVAGWQTTYGDAYFEVNHVYCYDSLAEMERLRKVLHGDPYFREHNKVNTSPNLPNYWFSGATSRLLRALPYSRL